MADINIDLGNIRGLKGDPGDPGQDGQDGQDGARGSLWYTGTALIHTEGSAATATGIDGALAGDMYLNTETSSVYRCTTGGDSGEAVWTFLQNIRGANGNGSLTTSTASDGYTNVTFTDALGEQTTFRAGNTRATSTSSMSLAPALNHTVQTNFCYARGDVVLMALNVSGLSISINTARGDGNYYGTLPEGFRPRGGAYLPCLYRVSGVLYPGMLQVSASTGQFSTLACSASTGTITQLVLITSFMRA